MKRYIITGNFAGAVAVEYNEEGCLVLLDMREATLTQKQVEYLQRHLPYQNTGLVAFAVPAKLTIKEEDIEVNFELFYEKYGQKKGKNEAKRAWERLTKADRVKAYLYITAYNRDLKLNSWKTKMYPATYLHKKTWED